jgi:hypothetical protein
VARFEELTTAYCACAGKAESANERQRTDNAMRLRM